MKSAIRSSLVACTALFAVLASCATSSEPYAVPVRNDLSKTVTLALCDSRDCSKVTDRWVLKPGHTGAVNVEIHGGYDQAVVLGPTSLILGCLPFRGSTQPHSFMVDVSQAVSCGTSGGIAATHGRDWPQGF